MDNSKNIINVQQAKVSVLIDIFQKLNLSYESKELTHLESVLEKYSTDLYLAYIDFSQALDTHFIKNTLNQPEDLNNSQVELDHARIYLNKLIGKYQIQINWSTVRKIQGVIIKMVEDDLNNSGSPEWAKWSVGYSTENELPMNMAKGLYWRVEKGEALPIAQFLRKKGMSYHKTYPAENMGLATMIFVYRKL